MSKVHKLVTHALIDMIAALGFFCVIALCLVNNNETIEITN